MDWYAPDRVVGGPRVLSWRPVVRRGPSFPDLPGGGTRVAMRMGRGWRGSLPG